MTSDALKRGKGAGKRENNMLFPEFGILVFLECQSDVPGNEVGLVVMWAYALPRILRSEE